MNSSQRSLRDGEGSVTCAQFDHEDLVFDPLAPRGAADDGGASRRA
jgi:hypothetical protein